MRQPWWCKYYFALDYYIVYNNNTIYVQEIEFIVFVVCGLNHTTAPIDMREKIAFPGETHTEILTELLELPTVYEAVILSTCNRFEVYAETDDYESIIKWLANKSSLSSQDIRPYLYVHLKDQAILHSLRVASGLDSMMVGEPQILGQMKQAYNQSVCAKFANNTLANIFPYIFSASKRIRNRSGIGNNPVSIAYAAVQLVNKLFSDLKTLKVLIIGSGETSSLVVKYLQQQGAQHFMIASRTHENANQLAIKFSGIAVSINDLASFLPQADVVISATACPLPFISKNLVNNALIQRNNAPIFLLDLAVPRDIEANVNQLEGAHLYNLDDLQVIIDKGINERRIAASNAEALITDELQNYLSWCRTLEAKNVICNYRTQMHNLAKIELERAIQKLSHGQCQYTVLAEFSDRLVKKLTHRPTVGLRRAARDNKNELLDLAQYLLNHQVESELS
jgi:glutamyl-tRNA reductase